MRRKKNILIIIAARVLRTSAPRRGPLPCASGDRESVDDVVTDRPARVANVTGLRATRIRVITDYVWCPGTRNCTRFDVTNSFLGTSRDAAAAAAAVAPRGGVVVPGGRTRAEIAKSVTGPASEAAG